MTNVKMKATDQILISSVKSDTLRPGEEFEVSAAVADDLEKRGLPVERVEVKAEQAPENKMEPVPEDKKAAAPLAKRK
jgi:hypothetical protein